MDIELRPTLNHKGIVCVNNGGKWSVECVQHDTNKNTERAGLVCFSLGFSGYNFFNVSRVDENGNIQRRHQPSQERNAYYQDYLQWTERQAGNFGHGIYKRSVHTNDLHHQIESHEIIVGAPMEQCNALYLECVPHSHIPTDDPEPPSIDHTTIIPEPNPPSPDGLNHQTTVPNAEPEHATNSPLEPTILPAEHENATKPRIIEDNFRAPWIASVYVDGDLICIGVLLDRQWVLVENSCVESVEYGKFHNFH